MTEGIASVIDKFCEPLYGVAFRRQLIELYIASVKTGMLVRWGFVGRKEAVATLIEKASDADCWGRGASTTIWRGVLKGELEMARVSLQ